MALSESDRAAIRDNWLGGGPAELAALAKAVGPQPPEELGRRHQELRRYCDQLARESVRQTRRLALAYSSTAVARLVEIMRSESPETSRKAAVDLLRFWKECAHQELAEEQDRERSQEQSLTEVLTTGQYEQMASLLADAQATARRLAETRRAGRPALEHLPADPESPAADRNLPPPEADDDDESEAGDDFDQA